MKLLSQLLFIASITFFNSQAFGQASYNTGAIKNVSAHQAQEILKIDDIIILDIRTPGEYNNSRINGAININFYDTSFAENLQKLDKNKTYFVYCRSGNRTGQSMRLFSSLGFKDIYHLNRGIVDWTGSGYKMIK
jgi:rhodanese-related sulfurtransferase